MRKKNLRRLMPVALLLTLVLICGSVFAYMFMRTDTEGTDFIPAQVACKVYSPEAGDAVDIITVENTGNINAYLRVRLVTYWVDGDGNVAPKPSPTLTVSYNSTDWIKGSDNTFYYKVPVPPDAPDDLTTNLLTDPIILGTEDGYKQEVDIFGEAIQSKPTDAVKEVWPVTMDTDGTTIKSSP